jgi:hypothetical protein
MVVIISLSNAKTLSAEKNDFEMTTENASVFLTSTDINNPSHFDKREVGTDCVSCKFGIGKCCKPNICVKKTLQPDQCVEIKTHKPHHH